MPAGGAIAGGLVIGAIGNYLSGKAQADAAKEGQQLTAEQVAAAQQQAQLAAGYADKRVGETVPRIQGNLQDAYNAGKDWLTQGYGQGRQDILGAQGLAGGALAQGQANSLSSLYQGAGQGIGYLNQAQQGVDHAINSGIQGAQGALGQAYQTGYGINPYDVTNAQNRTGGMLDRDGGLFGGFEQDPGYQMRLKESEQAIMRSAAARGGRFSGETLKALQSNAANVASQGYNDFVNRRLQEYGAAGQNDAARQGLLLNQAGRTDAAGQQAAQNRMGAAGQLAGVYQQGASQMAGAQQAFGSQAGQMAYGMGQGAANIYGSGASALSNLYGQTGSQLAGQAIGGASALGQNESGYYAGLADLDWKQATTRAGYGLGAAGVAAQMVPTLAASNQAAVPYAGAGAAAIGQLGQGIGQLGAVYMGTQGAGNTPAGGGTANTYLEAEMNAQYGPGNYRTY